MKNHSCLFLSRMALPGLMSLILLAPAIARADLMTTFDVSGTAKNTSGLLAGSCAAGATCTFSGMFTVDTTTGTLESSGFDITFPGLPDFDTQPNLILGTAPNLEIGDISGKFGLALQFATAPNPQSLVGFTDGSIEGISGVETAEGGLIFSILGGSITPVPEPSSLVLLAGVIGSLLFGLKRRFRKKAAS